MMAGRAGMISAVNSRQGKKKDAKKGSQGYAQPKLPRNYDEMQRKRENRMMNKYGLERVDDVDVEVANLKRFKPSIKDEEANKQAAPQRERRSDGLYDHHAEILAERKDAEMQERAAELNALGYSETDPTGIQQIEEGEEFDDITRQLRNKTNFNGGRYRIREAKDTGELAQINVRESSENRLSFRKIPVVIWLSGTIVIITALYLIYHLALGHYGVLFKGYREGHWWQYFISFAMLLFGIVVLYAGKVESVIFDKQTGIVGKIKTSIFCTKKRLDWELDQIQNVRVYKRGHDGIQVMTIHFDIQLEFHDIPSTTILRTKDE